MKKMQTYAFLLSKSFMSEEVQGENLYDAWKRYESLYIENMSKNPHEIAYYGIPTGAYAVVEKDGVFSGWKTSLDKRFIKRVDRFNQQLGLLRDLDKATNQGGE